jgi:hypothetical protein
MIYFTDVFTIYPPHDNRNNGFTVELSHDILLANPNPL